MPMHLELKGIKDGGEIPREYTCDGENYSPEITIGEIPNGTKSLALIAEDPDAPVGLFVHWVIYNLPSSSAAINERIERAEVTKDGYKQGKNDFGRTGYDGPCPPRGHGFHRYYFRLFALRTFPVLQGPVDRAKLLKSIEGTVIEEASAMGKYKR